MTPRGLALIPFVLALAVAGCTVRPLYSEGAVSAAAPGAPAALAGVAVKPVQTRYAQEVRNHLIFLIGGGAGQPASSRYELTLVVTRLVETAAHVQRATVNQPTAGTLILTATYTLTETDGGRVIGTGRRSVSSSFDRPRQEFAVLRAERDAEDRAARELAELIRLAVAQDLLNPPPVALK